MSKFYPNGIGESLGSVLATCAPLLAGGDIWYVNSANGVDAVSPRGKDATRPLATVGQAHTNCAAGDIIVLMDGHAETMTNLTMNKAGVTIVGAGRSSGKPTVKLTAAGANSLITVAAVNCQVQNVWFEESLSANTSGLVLVSAFAGFVLKDCYFECGEFDDQSPLRLGNGCSCVRIENTTFISTATSLLAQPASAISSVNTVSGLVLIDVVVSNGAYGYENPFAVDLSAGIISALRVENMSLLLGADMTVNSASTGYVNVQTCTGGSRVDW